jgi:tRNA(Phe) wybutosine-synthesizing methylase Tyw3
MAINAEKLGYDCPSKGSTSSKHWKKPVISRCIRDGEDLGVKKEKFLMRREKLRLHGPHFPPPIPKRQSPLLHNMAPSLPTSFVAKKEKILQQLEVPAEQYDDLSPKGSVDEGIRDLIDQINALEGCVTTSSCAGRISVFLEGRKSASPRGLDGDRIKDGERVDAASKGAGIGGKGGGGRWLFVSHDPINIQKHVGAWTELFGMESEHTGGEGLLSLGGAQDTRFIHFKFEPMVCRQLLFFPAMITDCP